jgi:hypothetical protein
MDEEQVLELGNLPEIYADGIGRVTPCGPNVKLQLWTWTEIGGVLQRVAVATIIRPFDSLVLTQDDIRQRAKLAQQRLVNSGAWHLIWFALFDWDDIVPLAALVLGPLH